MVDQRIYDLVKQLHKKTEEGKLNWETTVDGKAYQFMLPRSAIKIEGNEDRNVYRISIANQEGLTVESFTNLDLEGSRAEEWIEGYAELMKDIYKKARRAALASDRVIDEVLAKLGEV